MTIQSKMKVLAPQFDQSSPLLSLSLSIWKKTRLWRLCFVLSSQEWDLQKRKPWAYVVPLIQQARRVFLFLIGCSRRHVGWTRPFQPIESKQTVDFCSRRFVTSDPRLQVASLKDAVVLLTSHTGHGRLNDPGNDPATQATTTLLINLACRRREVGRPSSYPLP